VNFPTELEHTRFIPEYGLKVSRSTSLAVRPDLCSCGRHKLRGELREHACELGVVATHLL